MEVTQTTRKFSIGSNYCRLENYIIDVDGKAYRISNYYIQNPKKYHKLIWNNKGEKFVINIYNNICYKVLE